jgi:hypothetical protein
VLDSFYTPLFLIFIVECKDKCGGNKKPRYWAIMHSSGYEPELHKSVDSKCADFWLLEDPMPILSHKLVDHVTNWQGDYPEDREPHPPMPP